MMFADTTWDVAVLGGGSAGIAAAVAAAREGARTLLVERHGYCGGMGTAALVHSFCGLYLLREAPGAVLANPGIPSEIADRTIAATGIGPQRMGRVDVLPQHPVEFVALGDALIAAEPNLTPLFHTEATAIHRVADDFWEITLAGRDSIRKILSRILIDASGDAIAATLLGADSSIAEAPRLQRPAYVFGIQGVREGGPDEGLRIAGIIVEGIRAGRLDKATLGIAFRPSGRPGETFGTIDLSGNEADADYDPTSPRTLTALEIQGRSIATCATMWLRENHPGWQNAYISHWPARAGIRESRRWTGEQILTGDDIRHGRRFSDEIALATWPMEFRETTRGPKLVYPIDDRPTGIPLPCLRPRGIDRLWVAGRCISTDHDAQASIRVMGTCFATGEAAGRAAAREASA
jgi:hypothetical protein